MTADAALAEMRADAESENLTMPFRMYAGGLSARIKAALKRRDEALLAVADKLDALPGRLVEVASLAARIRAIVEGK